MAVRVEPVDGLLLVDAASTASLTLSGLQTVDTVALTAGKLCLAKNQGSSVQAVYLVQSGAWIPVDPGIGFGMQVCVRGGSQAGSIFQCTTLDPIVWGTTATTFVSGSGGTNPSVVAASPLQLKSGTVTPASGTTTVSGNGTGETLVDGSGNQETFVLPDGLGSNTGTSQVSHFTKVISLADSATFDFSPGQGGIARVAATNGTAPLGMVVFANDGTCSTNGVTYTNFSTTIATASKLNVGKSGSNVRVENKLGVTAIVMICVDRFAAL